MYKPTGSSRSGIGYWANQLWLLSCLIVISPHFGSAKDLVRGKLADRLNQDSVGQISFSSPLEAYRQGKTAFDEGWYDLALPALRFAAKRGVFGARLKLAKMYEYGLGVPVNEPAAFELYSQVSHKNWNISSYHPASPYIGQALSSLGLYYLNGIEENGLKADLSRAVTHFSHAAQYFGDPRAQYELARLYLAGQGVKKNTKRAISWLNNATKKKHAPSQALLGQLFWEGEVVAKRRIKALALLTMAQTNAGPADSEWIGELYNTIVDQSEPKARKKARAVVARWISIYDPKQVKRRIVIRKEVHIGLAEGRRTVRTKRVIEQKIVPRNEIARENAIVPGNGIAPGSDQRIWMGLGSFREIDMD